MRRLYLIKKRLNLFEQDYIEITKLNLPYAEQYDEKFEAKFYFRDPNPQQLIDRWIKFEVWLHWYGILTAVNMSELLT